MVPILGDRTTLVDQGRAAVAVHAPGDRYPTVTSGSSPYGHPAGVMAGWAVLADPPAHGRACVHPMRAWHARARRVGQADGSATDVAGTAPRDTTRPSSLRPPITSPSTRLATSTALKTYSG